MVILYALVSAKQGFLPGLCCVFYCNKRSTTQLRYTSTLHFLIENSKKQLKIN